MVHPHFTAELTRAHRDDLSRAAQARRLVRTARPAPVRVRPARWITVLRWASRRVRPAGAAPAVLSPTEGAP
jgi:hypothetical protein